MLTKKEYCYKLSLILLNSVRGEGLKHNQMWWRPNSGCFHNHRNKLFSGKPILQFGAAPFVPVLVELHFLTALFALLPS